MIHLCNHVFKLIITANRIDYSINVSFYIAIKSIKLNSYSYFIIEMAHPVKRAL